MRWVLLLMAAGVVVQVFLAGLGIFGGGGFDRHVDVGWTVHTIGLLAFILALIGPRTRTAVVGTLGLVVLNTVQIMLSGAEAPGIAALHPTLALAVLALALWLARATPRPVS